MSIACVTVPMETTPGITFKQMILAGGIGVMGCADPTKFAAIYADLPAACRDCWQTPESVFVFMMEPVAACFTQGERDMMRYHEEGHHVLGHANGAQTEWIVDPVFENEADDYACTKGDRAVLCSALEKLERVHREVILPMVRYYIGTPTTASVQQYMQTLHDNVTPRIRRLQTVH